MTAREYQERLDRLLCLNCGRATRPQPNGQAYCPRCRRLDSFVRRRQEWVLVRAFVAGVTATAAAVVAGVTTGTAAKHFRRFRRALVEETAADTAAAYRRLKLKPASTIRRKSARNPAILGLIQMGRRMVFVWPRGPSAVVLERLRATRTPGVVLSASPGSGFAALRLVQTDLVMPPLRTTTVRPVLRFWASARTAVLRHRAVRWAEVDGFLAEQVFRQRTSTRRLIDTLFERLVRLKPVDQSGK